MAQLRQLLDQMRARLSGSDIGSAEEDTAANVTKTA